MRSHQNIRRGKKWPVYALQHIYVDLILGIQIKNENMLNIHKYTKVYFIFLFIRDV